MVAQLPNGCGVAFADSNPPLVVFVFVAAFFLSSVSFLDILLAAYLGFAADNL